MQPSICGPDDKKIPNPSNRAPHDPANRPGCRRRRPGRLARVRSLVSIGGSILLTPIAQSSLWISKPRGSRRRITVCVGQPERDPRGSNYRCLVTIRGLGRKRFVCGVDSLQSLMLATVLLNVEIATLSRQGYRFFMSKSGKDAVDLSVIWQCDVGNMERLFRTMRSSQRRPASAAHLRCSATHEA